MMIVECLQAIGAQCPKRGIRNLDIIGPNAQLAETEYQPLLERNPLGFWRGLSLMLFVLNSYLLYRLFG